MILRCLNFSLLVLVSLAMGCNSPDKEPPVESVPAIPTPEKSVIKTPDYDTLQWTEITEDMGVELDLRYASNDNFTDTQIYDCGRCFLRPALADKIISIQQEINNRYGWRLKLYDCYRPRPAQSRLWDKVPDARYVTPPAKGSMHNRGLAVDINIIDEHGIEMEMGTPYDDFTRLSHTDHRDLLPLAIMKNRDILKKIMEINGLTGIRTEWWHYSLKGTGGAFSDWEWTCD